MREVSLDQISWKKQREDMISSLCKEQEVDVNICYISDFSSAKILREFVDSVCKHFGVSPKWRTRIVLIIDELNNNAIEYGSKKGDTNYLHLQLKKIESSIFLHASVIDTWKGSSPKTAIDMQKLRKKHLKDDFLNHDSIRGRGLFLIISQLVDKLCFSDNTWWGLKVGIEKKLPVSS